jgi:hypothetical protein
MSNVSNPSGPVNPLNPQQPTGPIKPGSDKFQELMKVDPSSERQKKKKKRQTETEEENKAKLQAGPAQVDRLASTKRAEKYPKIQKTGESEKKQTKHGKRSEETPTELAREEAAALGQKKQIQPLEISKNEDEIEDNKEVKQTTASGIQAHTELEKTFEEEAEISQKEEIGENFKNFIGDKEKSKKENIQQPTSSPSTTVLGPLFLPPPTATPPAYSLLSPEALALFEKMVSIISILKDNGITETTLHLDTPEFADSQFYGAQIVIREYSTAPLTYNIELLGNPLAAELFQKKLPILRSAFDDPKYRFRINRLESSISQEPYSRVERKEESPDHSN